MIDIVFPKNDEKEFIQIAEKLGYSSIVFAYQGKIPNLDLKTKVKIYTSRNIRIAKATGDDRHAIEKKNIDLIYGLEEAQKRDFMHHRASGLNQVLCKITKKRKIIIGFSLSSLLDSRGMLRAQLLGRIMQNIRFCRKYKVATAFCSFAHSPYQMRSANDMVALAESIGMTPGEARNSLRSVEEKVKKNLKSKKTGITTEGIEII